MTRLTHCGKGYNSGMQAVGDATEGVDLTGGHPDAARGLIMIGDLRPTYYYHLGSADESALLRTKILPSADVGNCWSVAGAAPTDAKD